ISAPLAVWAGSPNGDLPYELQMEVYGAKGTHSEPLDRDQRRTVLEYQATAAGLKDVARVPTSISKIKNKLLGERRFPSVQGTKNKVHGFKSLSQNCSLHSEPDRESKTYFD